MKKVLKQDSPSVKYSETDIKDKLTSEFLNSQQLSDSNLNGIPMLEDFMPDPRLQDVYSIKNTSTIDIILNGKYIWFKDKRAIRYTAYTLARNEIIRLRKANALKYPKANFAIQEFLNGGFEIVDAAGTTRKVNFRSIVRIAKDFTNDHLFVCPSRIVDFYRENLKKSFGSTSLLGADTIYSIFGRQESEFRRNIKNAIRKKHELLEKAAPLIKKISNNFDKSQMIIRDSDILSAARQTKKVKGIIAENKKAAKQGLSSEEIGIEDINPEVDFISLNDNKGVETLVLKDVSEKLLKKGNGAKLVKHIMSMTKNS